MKIKRYSNGEVITKSRMEDEPWYDHYQTLMELHSIGDSVEVLYENYLKDYKKIFKKQCPNKEQVLRWSVMLVERLLNWLRCLQLNRQDQCSRIIKDREMFDKEKDMLDISKIKELKPYRY